MSRNSARPTISRAAAIAAIVLAASVVPARAGEEDNRKRLEAMPREHRVQLGKTLDEFDALPSPERSAVRDLDAAIAGLSPVKQAQYRALLRRYHVWLGGLDDKQREELANAATTDSKLALVTKWRKAEREADTRARKNMIFVNIRAGDLGSLPPFEMADALRVWFQLDEKERAEVERLGLIPERIVRLRVLGRQKRIFGRSFPASSEEALVAQLAEDEKVKQAFPRAVAKREKKAEADDAKAAGTKAAGTKGETPKKVADTRPGYPLHLLAESLYFNQHPPAAVTAGNLTLFEAQIPAWLRATIDPLPPDDARRKLTVLYRQIYPEGKEIPPPAKAEPAKAKAKAAPAAPTEPTPAPAAPF